MKARFVIILSILFLFGFTAQSFSQGMGGMNPQERIKQQLKTYKERLKLTDAQFKKVDTILNNQMNEIQKLRDNSGGDRESMREGMMSLREKTNKKIEALLNDTQKAEFKKIQEEAAQRRQGMGRG
ncbi:MAG: hypothetical protein A3J84_03905 [Ignavibacteria bacterium RIFOXYA2_FULL_37_17]|nr:MAG: hypothetical protein A3J84_03905 [Ignavibacteria bacterium RIFOXYA2_FULL_37_17]